MMQITASGTYGCPGLPLGLRSVTFMSDLDFVLPLAGPHALSFTPPAPVQSLREMDEGIRIIAQVVNSDGIPVNVRAATTKLMKLMLPDGTALDISGTLFSNGADGKIYFTSSGATPPFDQVGEWLLQVRLVIGGVSQSSKTVAFAVEPNIDAN